MSKGKDKRYKTVKILIDNGLLKSLSDIFDTIPRSTVAKDFGTNFPRFDRLLNNVEQFRLKEIYTLASIFDVEEAKLLDLVHNQYVSKRKGKK
jgi:hypothetical protein